MIREDLKHSKQLLTFKRRNTCVKGNLQKMCETLSESDRKYPNQALVGVSTICWNERLVLLILRGHNPYKGYWSLPGGLVKLGEKLEAAVLRELLEESGISARIISHFETFDSIETDSAGRVSHHYVLSVYESEFVSGITVAGDDAIDIGWFSLERLRELKLTPGTEERIRKNFDARFKY